MDLYARVPIVWGSVYNNRMVDDDGEPDPIDGAGLGDIHAGFHMQWLRKVSEDGRFATNIRGELDMRMPTGQESPGSYVGGPNNVVTVLTGTGTWGFDFGARLKQKLARLALELGVGIELNPTATVMYLVEDEKNWLNQHLDPGERFHFDFGMTMQFFDHMALQSTLFFDYRFPTRWGGTQSSIPACADCEELPGSDGLYTDIEARLITDVNIHLGIDAYFRYTLGGRHNFLWPLEEISPSRGWTAGANLAYRF